MILQMMTRSLLICLLLFSTNNLRAQGKTDRWLKDLLTGKASTLLQHVLNHPDSFQFQIIYTEINRDKNNLPKLTNHYYNVDRNRYYNPASTVKLPTAVLALEKMNALEKQFPIGKYANMFIDSSYSGQTAVTRDTSSLNGYASVANYVKKIFLVSDNDAYNRLYEWDAQEPLNMRLWSMGYKDVRITRRFVTMTEEENRHTNKVRFENSGERWEQPALTSNISFDFSKQILVGKGHFNRYDSLINEPMDFTKHNNLPLEDLQKMLQSVIFPESVPEKQRFRLTDDDRQFLLKYMSELPSESRKPTYDTSEYFDSYCKFFLYKSGKQKPPPNIRIFNKPGWSYGYLTDAAYIVDFASNTEFMISAVIYVNRDGILNDDKYEYKEIGYPFFKEIGEIMYNYDKNRKREYKPDLKKFRFDYN